MGMKPNPKLPSPEPRIKSEQFGYGAIRLLFSTTSFKVQILQRIGYARTLYIITFWHFI